MSWFLVLLFWSPQIQEYGPLNNWDPRPYATYGLCDKTLQYVEQYLLESETTIMDCIQAKDEATAINILKR